MGAGSRRVSSDETFFSWLSVKVFWVHTSRTAGYDGEFPFQRSCRSASAEIGRRGSQVGWPRHDVMWYVNC